MDDYIHAVEALRISAKNVRRALAIHARERREIEVPYRIYLVWTI